MKYTIERLPESRVAIDVEIEQEAVEAAVNRIARRLAQRARIPGFRPGKAPRYIVEMHFGRSTLYEEASEELVKETLREIVDKGEIEPVGQAEVEKLELEPFSFRLVIPVRPTVTLGDYRALRFPEEVYQVTDEDVEHALKHLQDEQTVWKEPDPLRPAQVGDRLTADLLGRVEEKTIEDRKGVEIVVGNEELLPGFEALVGVEAGQVVEIAATLPAELEDKELAGRPASFTVTVHGLKEPEVPPLDDEFARNLGEGEETLAALRARLRDTLEERARTQARDKVLEQMLNGVVEGATLELPQAMVDDEAQSLFEEQAAQFKTYGISLDQYLRYAGQTEEEYRKLFALQAPGRLRRYLVLREFLRAEGLQEGSEMQKQLEDRLLAIARGELEPVAAAAVGEGAGPVEADLPEPPTDAAMSGVEDAPDAVTPAASAEG